jgi:YggT family protein
MLGQILNLLIDTVASFFATALLARFALQAARAPFRNPLGQFVMAVTNWMVVPARRFVPSAWGYDSASLVLAWAWQVLNIALMTLLTAHAFSLALMPVVGVLLIALLEVFKIGLYLIMGVVLISAIFSWINPYAPLADLFNSLSRPWLQPFRKLIPPVGGVDLTPLALLVAVQVALIVLAGARGAVLSLLYV